MHIVTVQNSVIFLSNNLMNIIIFIEKNQFLCIN